MKIKLLNALTVGLVTLALISPSILIIGVVLGQRELVKTQNLSCESPKINIGSQSLSTTGTSLNLESFVSPVRKSQDNLLYKIQRFFNKHNFLTIIQWLFLGIPIFIGVMIIGYDRYLIYRSAVLKSQIALLERMWEQSIEQ